MWKSLVRLLSLVATCLCLSQCGVTPAGMLMGGPDPELRAAEIASEPTGDFYYGRRYFVEKTRFWGYLRKPREPWTKARLVIMREDRMHVPDRLPEDGPSGQRYGYDQNHDYRIRGYFTGKDAYDPNSNQILPVFMLTGYDLLDKQPGWLFSPDDRYHPQRITLMPPRR